jgi:hypothetical protein
LAARSFAGYFGEQIAIDGENHRPWALSPEAYRRDEVIREIHDLTQQADARRRRGSGRRQQ